MSVAYLTREQILAGLTQHAERDMFIASLGGTVRIRELARAQLRAANTYTGDQWNLAIIAAGVIDPATKQPLFTSDELLPLVDGDDPAFRPSAALHLAQAILDLSEVGPEYLKSGDTAVDAE